MVSLLSTTTHGVPLALLVLSALLAFMYASRFAVTGAGKGSAVGMRAQVIASLRANARSLEEERTAVKTRLRKARATIVQLQAENEHLEASSRAAPPAAPARHPATATGPQRPMKVPFQVPTQFRLFIVAYNQNKDLFKCLDSVLASDLKHYRHEVYVLNNYGVLRDGLPQKYAERGVRVLDNVRRADFSTGHLSRDWNHCLVNGFQSLATPKSEYVVCMQTDNEVAPKFASTLVALHRRYTLVNAGIGDAFTSYTAAAVRRIGIWDERYSNIGWQDFDYWFRAMSFAGDIGICFMQKDDKYAHEDYQAAGFPCELDSKNKELPKVLSVMRSGWNDHSVSHKKSIGFHTYGEAVFREKWPHLTATKMSIWGISTAAQMRQHNGTRRPPAIPTFRTYPYFERDLENSSAIGLSPPWGVDAAALWRCSRT